MKEVWDVLNCKGEKINKKINRGEKLNDDEFHLVVNAWIKNKDGKFLIVQRSINKTYPLMWECVGGSVLMGESSIDGALREVKEEVGLDLEPETGKILFTKIRGTFNDIVDVWLFEYNGDLHLDDATTDEVSDCRWMTVSEIRKLYEDNRLVQTLDYFFCAMEADQNSSLSWN